MSEQKYLQIASHYEACLERSGDTYRGVDWPRSEDVDTRYRVMMEVVRPCLCNWRGRLHHLGVARV
jgi:hypothetical protein